MKIGDQVRFLSEVGGGRVSGFQGKNIVLVEDEDGFEIPMLMQDVVVVGNEEYDIGKVNTAPSPSLSQGGGSEEAAQESLPPRGKVWKGAFSSPMVMWP